MYSNNAGLSFGFPNTSKPSVQKLRKEMQGTAFSIEDFNANQWLSFWEIVQAPS